MAAAVARQTTRRFLLSESARRLRIWATTVALLLFAIHRHFTIEVEECFQVSACDSSLFPVRRPGGGYGYANGLPDPHWLERPAGRLAEIPPTTLRWCGVRLPAAGGAYFRLLPYRVVRAAFRQYEHRGVSGTFYIH